MKKYHKCLGVTIQAHNDACTLAKLLAEQTGMKVSISSAVKWAIEKAIRDMQVKQDK